MRCAEVCLQRNISQSAADVIVQAAPLLDCRTCLLKAFIVRLLQVGVFDATNSTRERRNMILRMAEGKCKVIFLETICTDPSVIDRNVREKVRSSPDYVNIADPEAAIRDFKGRIENYERAYEPVNEGSYVKLIDMASGSGGQMQINNISGYLPGRIVFFLVSARFPC